MKAEMNSWSRNGKGNYTQQTIIHGVQEYLPENEDSNDAKFINTLFQTMGIDIRPESITRLGKPNPNKSQPVKLKCEG